MCCQRSRRVNRIQHWVVEKMRLVEDWRQQQRVQQVQRLRIQKWEVEKMRLAED